ncbi:MAG: hypothetical protein HYZ10_06395 [Ignavibacteriales bacterium]|nr:hypothetical protein [Ignavibacteriales bacterium]
MKTRLSIKSVLTAGLVATIAMTIFTFMAPLMGFEMDIPKMLAGAMSAPLFIGWLAHFMAGLVLAVIYAAIFLAVINEGANFKNGALFGIFPWLLAQLMVMPMMSLTSGGSFVSGLFSGSLLIAMASLMGHLLYGAVLGFLYKPQSV